MTRLTKRLRASDKFELMYLIRKEERNGWSRGRVCRNEHSHKTWECRMFRKGRVTCTSI